MSLPDGLTTALDALYGPPTSRPLTDIDAVNRALLEAQARPEAWTWLETLLSSENASHRFFGASTLAAKCDRDLASLPPGARDQLRASVLRWLSRSALDAFPSQSGAASRPGERVVLRKLTAAAVMLAIRSHPNGEWPNWFGDILDCLAGAGSGALFECVIVVLEEITRANLTAQERVVFDQRVHTALPRVVDAVCARLADSVVTDEAAAGEINAALRCVSAALASNDLVDPSVERLFPLVLPLITQPSVSVCASATIEDLIGSKSKLMTPKRMEALLDALASPSSAAWLAQAAAERDVDDHVLGLIKLLATAIDDAASTLAEGLGSPRTTALLERLLSIASFPGHFAVDEEVSELALLAWTSLYEALADEGRTESSEAKAIFGAVAQALRVKCRLPGDDELRTWPRDVRQRFQVYRNDAVNEALLSWFASDPYCTQTLTRLSFYVLRADLLSALLDLAASQVSSDADRNDLEATLFALSCVAEGVSAEADDQVRAIFESTMLTSIDLPSASPRRLGRTALVFIGVRLASRSAAASLGPFASLSTLCASWSIGRNLTCRHQNLAEWLHHHNAHLLAAVQFVVSGLQTETHSQAASRTLRKLCSACRVELGAHIGSFAGLLGQLEGRIPSADFVKVLASVAAVVQALPPDTSLESSLAITEPVIERLGQAVEALTSGREGAREACLHQLAALGACASGLAHPEQELLDLDNDPAPSHPATIHPAIAHSQRAVLGCLQRLVPHAGADLELVQALAEAIRAMTASTLPTPVSLDPLSAFELCAAPNLVTGPSGVLWLPCASSVVARLAKSIAVDDAQRQGRSEAAVASCFQSAFGALSGSAADPELLPTILDLAVELIRVAPTVLAPQPQLTASLVSCCTAALHTQERVTLQRAVLVLIAIAHESSAEAPLSTSFRPIILAQGRDVLGIALVGLAGGVPDSCNSSFAELLHAFVYRLPSQTRLWLGDLLAQPGFPSSRLDTAAKTRFLQAVVASSRAIKKIRVACDELSRVSRGQSNDYASKTPDPILY